MKTVIYIVKGDTIRNRKKLFKFLNKEGINFIKNGRQWEMEAPILEVDNIIKEIGIRHVQYLMNPEEVIAL